MHLREGEQILKIYHHHYTPFVFLILKIIVGILPFFILLFMFQELLSTQAFVITNLVILLIFALVVAYASLIYWLDRLIITNQRVVFINWRYLTVKDEAEAFWGEIEDIKTQEKGVLAYFYTFDYGSVEIETAASSQTINFVDAPDPESIRQFIFHVRTQL